MVVVGGVAEAVVRRRIGLVELAHGPDAAERFHRVSHRETPPPSAASAPSGCARSSTGRGCSTAAPAPRRTPPGPSSATRRRPPSAPAERHRRARRPASAPGCRRASSRRRRARECRSASISSRMTNSGSWVRPEWYRPRDRCSVLPQLRWLRRTTFQPACPGLVGDAAHVVRRCSSLRGRAAAGSVGWSLRALVPVAVRQHARVGGDVEVARHRRGQPWKPAALCPGVERLRVAAAEKRAKFQRLERHRQQI